MKGGERERSSLVDFDVVATFPADNITIYCAAPLEDEEGHVLFGTSKGLFIGSARNSPAVQPVFAKDARGPESVFQIGLLAECNDVLMVVGAERRLVVAKTEDLLPTKTGARHRFKHRNIEVVNCCHRFAARKFGPDSDRLNVDERRDDTFVCAVDDRRVSILARANNTGEYQLR